MPVYMLNDNLEFPDPEYSEPGGLLAVGGDLSTERLLLAYRLGIFPWYSEDQPILWFSPETRLVFYPEKFKPSRTLKKILKSGKFEMKVDTDFETVIRSCAAVKRKHQSGTWITGEMIDAYTELYKLGYAHSFETYMDEKLVGGLYGLSLGGAFFGESMFHTENDASKVAFCSLADFSINNGFDFIDSQVPTEHMLRMGGFEIERKKFLRMLNKSLQKKTIKGRWQHRIADSIIKNS